MSLPPDFYRQGVCRLNKSLYGLKQALRNWFAKLSTYIINAGFTQSKVDYSLFTMHHGDISMAILVYVDDIILAGNDITSINQVKDLLHQNFYIKDLGDLKYFLGIEVAQSKEDIFLSQCKYILEILDDSGLLGARPVDTPRDQKFKLALDDGTLLDDPSLYYRMIGRLIYLNLTWPDIVYPIHILSQFMHKPKKPYMDAAFQVLHYLKGKPGQGILLSSSKKF